MDGMNWCFDIRFFSFVAASLLSRPRLAQLVPVLGALVLEECSSQCSPEKQNE